MISLILGHKGSGKTKRLIAEVEAAVEMSNGNVICVEKETLLTYEVNYRARLVGVEHYGISGYEAFYGFISGICAGDHDITDILIDATLRIGGRDFNELAVFLKKLSDLSKTTDTKITLTVSADADELPKEIFDFCEQI